MGQIVEPTVIHPVLITGMHRSGTTMIAQMLEQAGLFIGIEKEQNFEAHTFLRINRWLLSVSGGSWDQPSLFHSVLQNDALRAHCLATMKRMLKSPRIIQYLGLRNFLKYRCIARLDIPWGWKDPRTIFTLPLWLELYPNATVIHVYRHGVDVANSLREREFELLGLRRSRWQQFRTEVLTRNPIRIGAPSARCHELSGGFSLWECYMAEAQKHSHRPKLRWFDVKYEDFVQQPVRQFMDLLIAAELHCSVSTVESIAQQVRPDRAFAYRHDPELLSFAESVSDQLAMYGY